MTSGEVPPDQLIAAYADDPASLTAAERRAVEELCARDPSAAKELTAARLTMAALREAHAAGGEPDWKVMEERIAHAVSVLPWWRRRVVVYGALAAVAATVALLAFPSGRRPPPPPVAVEPALSDDELAAELDVPDDLGGITVDDALIDEAAALDDELPGGPDDDERELEQLVPDTTWIDELSDEDLDRAVEILAQEAT